MLIQHTTLKHEPAMQESIETTPPPPLPITQQTNNKFVFNMNSD